MRMLLPLLLAGLMGSGCQTAEKRPKALDCGATYVACGCGCCGGTEPKVTCLSCANGDDLQALIEADQKAAKDPQCATAGCSPGTKYVYCDANPG
ncbi:hypothetical protein [Corallococcus silvisoli]|uniref:hypothetical protein n=1 Tax=Corallococcus silvisoli TaxID=2697031 RepID=UPI001377D0B7|nr:hypothetical protein [Corallococcus silvisoli]NBD12425.1 hypothetical protein [Corallococcus silvisoli]